MEAHSLVKINTVPIKFSPIPTESGRWADMVEEEEKAATPTVVVEKVVPIKFPPTPTKSGRWADIVGVGEVEKSVASTIVVETVVVPTVVAGVTKPKFVKQCKHWFSKGFCNQQATCTFLHPTVCCRTTGCTRGIKCHFKHSLAAPAPPSPVSVPVSSEIAIRLLKMKVEVLQLEMDIQLAYAGTGGADGCKNLKCTRYHVGEN